MMHARKLRGRALPAPGPDRNRPRPRPAPMLAAASGKDGPGAAAPAASHSDAESPAGNGTRRLGAPRVVVVEDEFIIAMEIETLLEDLGARIVGTATSAQEAVDMAERLRPDFMTMDINIRGPRDGVYAAQEINDRFGIRSVFISAYTDKAMLERGTAADPIAWLDKPVSRQRLGSVVRRFCGDDE